MVKESPIVAIAARNNAEWCHAFSATHGVCGIFESDWWRSRSRTPPYYPDAVTFVRNAAAAVLLERIELGAGCSVKDSFADLDLGREGFEILFRADWLSLEPETAAEPGNWSVVTTPIQLAQWEAGWAGSTGGVCNFFRPALLVHGSLALLASVSGDRVVAGAVAYRSEAVIGLTDLFDAGGDLEAAWRSAAAAASARWGPLPIVGYDLGESLVAAHHAGFVTVGELAVWTHPGDG